MRRKILKQNVQNYFSLKIKNKNQMINLCFRVSLFLLQK